MLVGIYVRYIWYSTKTIQIIDKPANMMGVLNASQASIVSEWLPFASL